MKKILSVLLAAALCLGLLAGCGAAPAPEVTPAPEATATPEPPSTVPDPTAAPESAAPEPTEVPAEAPGAEKNGMYELLAGVFDDLHAGTAGSSLTAARYAASLVDWTAQNGADAAAQGAAAWDRGMETEFGESLEEKLALLYSTALALTGPYRAVLADCGYEGDWDYTAREVHSAYGTVFTALGLDTPVMLLVWVPNEDVSRMNALAAEVMDLSAETVSGALTDYAGLAPGAVRSLSVEEGVIRADLGGEFWDQVRAMGTSGEYVLVGSLVNTLLDAYGADSVAITVNGQIPETGHNIYDYALERYAADPGEG